jgi:hypothetical protein
VKITLETFLKWIDEKEEKTTQLVRVLKPFKIALPDKDLVAFKEDVLTLEVKIAKILQKEGYIEIIQIEEDIDDLGSLKQEDMEDVEA